MFISFLWVNNATDSLYLCRLRDDTHNLRSRAYGATTLLKDYHELFRGLSYSIWVACLRVKELRALIIVSLFMYQLSCSIHAFIQDHKESRTAQCWYLHRRL